MEATEVGVRIRVDAIISLTGSTSRNLRVKGPTDAVPRDLAMTIDVPDNFAIRSTISTDFPVGGNYLIQLRAQFADGRDLSSPLQVLHVDQSVAAVC